MKASALNGQVFLIFPDSNHKGFPLDEYQGAESSASIPGINGEGRNVAGRILRRAITELTLDTKVLLSRTAQGKPYLPAHPEIQISIAHSRDIGVVTLAGVPVGVDLESSARSVSHAAIARRYFSEAESSYLSTQDDDRQRSLFLDLWMARESAAKCSGVGLAGSLEGARCVWDSESVTAIETRQGRFSLTYVDLWGPWRVCVAIQGAPLPVHSLCWPRENEGHWKLLR
jgi:phosphopantetheinyl transferase